MKRVIASVCAFLGALILLNMLEPLRTVLFRPFGFAITLAYVGACVMGYVVFKAIK